MEVMLEKKESLGKLVSPVEIYPQLLKNVRVKSKPDARNDEDVKAVIARVEGELGTDGRVLVRESGTEPLLRVMVEAKTDELCGKYVDEIVAVLEQKGHIIG